MDIKILAQRDFIKEITGKTETITIHFVMSLEQRKFYKWLRLTATVNQLNHDMTGKHPALTEELHIKEQNGLIREITNHVKTRLLDKSHKTLRIVRHIDVGE